MCSIFKFFADLAENKESLKKTPIHKFSFDEKMILVKWTGKFPDMVLRRNAKGHDNPLLSGGEFIEMKNSESGYTVPSFNSTIPSGEKKMADAKEQKGLEQKMKDAGDDVRSFSVRQVYYLLRSKHKDEDKVKVCLVHGSFFATVGEPDLVYAAIRQIMEDAISGVKLISPEAKQELLSAEIEKEVITAPRRVKNASVSLRFRVMTEAIRETNIMRHQEIGDNTLNFIVPLHDGKDEEIAAQESEIVKAAETTDILGYPKGRQFRIEHPFNGQFWVLQIPI